MKRLIAAVLLAGLSSCGGDYGESADEAPDALRESNRVLAIGDSGTDVHAVNQYLEDFGYFPNSRLQAEYPRWTPAVETGAPNFDIYDQATTDGVVAVQRDFGLTQTGIVNAPTRQVLLQPRCGTPKLSAPDPTEKFANASQIWSKTILTWKVTNSYAGISAADVAIAVINALASWSGPTQYTFTQVSGSSDINVTFSATDIGGGPWATNSLASAQYPEIGRVYIRNSKTWSVASPTPSGAYDLESVLVHELGHAIGIEHSSFPSAIMSPRLGSALHKRALTPDDTVAALAKSLAWHSVTTTIGDVDVDDSVGKLYVTANPAIAGGKTVFSSTNGGITWSPLSGQGAVRVAAKNGSAWIVQDDGDIYERVGSSWTQRSGCATDIGVGADGSVWIIGCTPRSGGYEIQKWSGSAFALANGGAVRISVGPRGPGDITVPWIINSSGTIYRRSTNSASSGAWNALSSGIGTDIAVSPAGYPWLIGSIARSGGFDIYAWEEQDNSADEDRAEWLPVTGGALNIAATDSGFPYISNSAGVLYEVAR